MPTRVNLIIKTVHPNERGSTKRIITLLRIRRGNHPYEYLDWLKEHNIETEVKEDAKDYYYNFEREEDAVAFKLRFGL